MNTHELARLQQPMPYPAVSLLLPLDGDLLPQVQLRLRHLAGRAVERLSAELDSTDLGQLAARLAAAIDGIRLTGSEQSVAVYVAEQSSVVPLSVRVRERVVVDETFATRDVVRAMQCSPRYRVLMLGPRRTRLYDGTGRSLTEAVDLGPELGRGGGLAEPRGRDAGGFRRSRRSAIRHDQWIRALDDALVPHLGDAPEPLVVVGAEPRLAAVASRSRYRDRVVGTLHGANDVPDHAELSRQVWPTIDRLLLAENAAAIDELEASGGRGTFVSGVDEVWTLANQGRGDLLLVEEGFEYSAQIDPTSYASAPAADRDAPGVVDDLVDEIIEAVLAKRGRCHIVPDGVLARYERIAMKLRY